MNDDHLDSVADYARYFAKAGGGGWVMTGIDADGFDLVAGDESRRVFFPSPLIDAREMRMVLIDMAKEARAALEAKT
jgi:putative heme iron utilization protein